MSTVGPRDPAKEFAEDMKNVLQPKRKAKKAKRKKTTKKKR